MKVWAQFEVGSPAGPLIAPNRSAFLGISWDGDGMKFISDPHDGAEWIFPPGGDRKDVWLSLWTAPSGGAFLTWIKVGNAAKVQDYDAVRITRLTIEQEPAYRLKGPKR